jgi:hypothetical protein
MHDSFGCIVCSFARKNLSRIGATGLPFTNTSSWLGRLPGLQTSGGDENNNITNHLISLTDGLIFLRWSQLHHRHFTCDERGTVDEY